MGRTAIFGCGLAALAATLALVCLSAILASFRQAPALLRTAALLAASFEAIVCLMLACFASSILLSSLASTLRRSSPASLTLLFGLAGLACVVGAAAAIASLIYLGLGRSSSSSSSSGPKASSLLAGQAAVLAIAVIAQTAFLTTYFLHCRRSSAHHSRNGGSSSTSGAAADSLFTDDSSRSSPKMRVKALRYSRIRPSPSSPTATTTPGHVPDSSTDSSIDLQSLDGSRQWSSPATDSSEQTRRGSSASSASTVTHLPPRRAVRPTTSRTQLLSRQGSMASIGSGVSTVHDGGSAWDLGLVPSVSASSLAPRSVSSPVRPPPLVLQGPGVGRGRSASATTAVQAQIQMERERRSRGPSSPAELDIHPLFRSDSADPPPLASPGTSVRASPDAGKVIPHHASHQSLRRLASATSLGSSPLSRQSSFDAGARRGGGGAESILEVDEERSQDDDEPLTPPIPDFVLNAGSRHSLDRYASRKEQEHQE